MMKKMEEEIKDKVEDAGSKIEKEVEYTEEIKESVEEVADDLKIDDEKVSTFRVNEDAPMDGKTIQEIESSELIDEDAHIIEIKRKNKVYQPNDGMLIKPGDIVKILSPNEITDQTRNAFAGERRVEDTPAVGG